MTCLIEYYTHEANIIVDGGYITFPLSPNFYGEGDWDDGVENMLKTLFPMATEVVVRSLEWE